MATLKRLLTIGNLNYELLDFLVLSFCIDAGNHSALFMFTNFACVIADTFCINRRRIHPNQILNNPPICPKRFSPGQNFIKFLLSTKRSNEIEKFNYTSLAITPIPIRFCRSLQRSSNAICSSILIGSHTGDTLVNFLWFFNINFHKIHCFLTDLIKSQMNSTPQIALVPIYI